MLTRDEYARLDKAYKELQSCANCWKWVWDKTGSTAARDEWCRYAGLAGDVAKKLREG